MKRRPGWVFWGVLALCLVWGLDDIFADPNRSTHSGSVYISEFSATGSADFLDEEQERSDWIELTNRSSRAVDLEGWTLTDDPTQPDKWTFRSQTLSPGQTLLVFASGKSRRQLDPEEGRLYLHTNFRLDDAGGFLALYPPTSRRFLDASVYEYPPQTMGLSYGLVERPDGRSEPRYLEPPTPGTLDLDQQDWRGVLPPVRFSTPHGLLSQPTQVALSTATPDAQIRYTLDGSTPTAENGIVYTTPLTLTETTVLRAAAFLPDFYPSPVVTQSYLFVADVLTQPAEPPGWPATWGTHRISRGPYEAGTPVEADYAVDPRVVNDPVDGPLLEPGLQALPSLSLVTDMANWDIYADPQTRGREMERPVSVEWIDPEGGPGFQVNAGVRIQGAAGRWEFMPKHSFRLFFRSDYGASQLDYPLFANSHVTTFDTLVLRGGVNYGFAGYVPAADGVPVDHRQTTYLRDAWARTTQLETSGVASHGRFVHLYLNGLYWGVYELVERPDDAFAAAYLGGDKDRWATINHGGFGSGDPGRFLVLLDLAQAGGLDDPERYALFLEFFDPAQFSDYVLLNWYAGNSDWQNNWYINVLNPAGRNYFFVWDAEATWQPRSYLSLGGVMPDGAPFPNIVTVIFEAAWANPDFRMTFADRAYRHLFNDGALTDATSQGRWQELQAQLDPAIVGESARWGDTRFPEQPISRGDWLAANATILQHMEGNAAQLLSLMTEAGYYPTLEPPGIAPRGGDFAENVTVTLTATQGVVYYTTDGSDPRAPGGEPAPTALRYGEPVVLTTTTRFAARAWADGEWSPLHEVRFAKQGEQAQVVISEIMYHPYEDEQMEFLELKNIGSTAADLSGAYFEGIDFRFAEGTTVAPGAHLVLIRDLSRFRRRYPDAEIHGVYRGKLSDKGETVTLFSYTGEVLAQVRYDDERGWPLSADGAGDSLVWVEGCAETTQRACWRASHTLYGTPGADEPGQR